MLGYGRTLLLDTAKYAPTMRGPQYGGAWCVRRMSSLHEALSR